jgi:hypothetical protein
MPAKKTRLTNTERLSRLLKLGREIEVSHSGKELDRVFAKVVKRAKPKGNQPSH